MLYAAGLLLPVRLSAGDEKTGSTFYDDLSTYEIAVRSRSTPILRVLQAGLAAPSAHNVQPWMFLLRGEAEALLFADPDRFLPQTDPHGRQILISQGTFLEMARIGGSLVGYRVSDEPFPEGLDRGVHLGRKPVARIRVTPVPRMEPDGFARWIPHRRSDRTAYEPEPISDTLKRELMDHSQDYHGSLLLMDRPADLLYLRNRTVAAFEIETNTFARHEESRRWFRYTDEEIYAKGDGISLRGNGLSGFRLWVARTLFLSPGQENWHSNSNRGAGVDMIREAVESTPLFAMLVTDANTPADQVRAGRDYLRFQLKAAQMGLRIHPLSQILQEYPEMESLRGDLQAFTGTSETKKVQMLLRVGRGRSGFRSPRRPLDELGINSGKGGVR
jgi:hypothetical protein